MTCYLPIIANSLVRYPSSAICASKRASLSVRSASLARSFSTISGAAFARKPRVGELLLELGGILGHALALLHEAGALMAIPACPASTMYTSRPLPSTTADSAGLEASTATSNSSTLASWRTRCSGPEAARHRPRRPPSRPRAAPSSGRCRSAPVWNARHPPPRTPWQWPARRPRPHRRRARPHPGHAATMSIGAASASLGISP